MATYDIRDDVIWPSDLARPPRPTALVYLDMLGFINLAKAKIGTAPDCYVQLLAAARRAVAEGRALFPLSSTHVLEVYSINSHDQRRSVVAVMEELGNFRYLLSRNAVQRLELEAAVNDVPGITAIEPQGPVDLLGPSLLWSFGKRGGLTTNAPDAVSVARQLCEAMGIDAVPDPMTAVNRWVERELLVGPEDHDDPSMVDAGYSRASWRAILEARAQQERDFAAALDADPQLRAGRLRDAVNAREMTIELIDIITPVTIELGTSIGALLEYDRTNLRDFSYRMPSTRVAAAIKERYHRDSRHNWTTNDINDIDALSIAVPYCDAVFTDKAARNSVNHSAELKMFGTELPRRPQELAGWLDDLPAA